MTNHIGETEMDWADEVCEKLDEEQEGFNFNYEGVARELRKAKADGMREAAEIVGMAAEEFRDQLGGESEGTLDAMENIAVLFDRIKQTIESAARHLHPPT